MSSKKNRGLKFPLPEDHEFYIVHDEKGRGDSVSYWYRSPCGSLLALTAGTVEAARRRRDQWMINRSQAPPSEERFHMVEADVLEMNAKYR